MAHAGERTSRSCFGWPGAAERLWREARDRARQQVRWPLTAESSGEPTRPFAVRQTDFAAALLLGVLLPGMFARPRFLTEHPFRAHIRLRWAFAYSTFAFAGL